MLARVRLIIGRVKVWMRRLTTTPAVATPHPSGVAIRKEHYNSPVDAAQKAPLEMTVRDRHRQR